MKTKLIIATFALALTTSLGAYAAEEGSSGMAPHSHMAEKGGAVSAPKSASKPASSSAKAKTATQKVAKHSHTAEKGGAAHAPAE